VARASGLRCPGQVGDLPLEIGAFLRLPESEEDFSGHFARSFVS